MFVVTFAAVTELVLGCSENISELFATLIAGRLEVFEINVDVVFSVVVIAWFEELVTKENEMSLNMEDVG